MKLYVYDHCPYCVKARMIFGFKDLPFEMAMVLNDDAETPTRLIGQKMVPILVKQDGAAMPESMDIVRYVDGAFGKKILSPVTNATLAQWIAESKAYMNRLCYPRWAAAPLGEFATHEAREYFTRKKEGSIGAFAVSMAQSAELIAQATAHLEKLEQLIVSPDAVNGVLSEDDFHLFAVLRSISIVRGVAYPPRVEAYRTAMAVRSAVPLHDDISL